MGCEAMFTEGGGGILGAAPLKIGGGRAPEGLSMAEPGTKMGGGRDACPREVAAPIENAGC